MENLSFKSPFQQVLYKLQWQLGCAWLQANLEVHMSMPMGLPIVLAQTTIINRNKQNGVFFSFFF